MKEVSVRVVAVVAVVAVGVAWAMGPVGAWGQEAGKPDALGVAPVDAATLARAIDRGRELVKGARWTYPAAARLLAVGGGRVFVVKGTPSAGLIGGDPCMVSLDAATGKQVGSDMAFAPGSSSILAGKRLDFPPAPAGRVRLGGGEQERLMDVGESGAGLELLDEMPNDRKPKVVLVSGTDKAAKWEVDAAGYHLLPAFAGDRVIVGGELYYLLRGGNSAGSGVREAKAIAIKSYDRETGKPQWSWPLPADTRQTSRPVVSGENVYFTFNHMTAEGREVVTGSSLAGLVMATGKEAWPTITIQATVSPPVVSGGKVMVVTDAGQVLAFDSATGKKVWEATISPGNDAAKSRVKRMRSPIESFTVTGLLQAPVADGERIYVSVSGVTDPPSTTTSNIYRDVSIGGMAAFDVRTGKQEWFFRSWPLPAGAPTNPGWESKELHWMDVLVAGDHVVGMALLWNSSRSLPLGLASLDRKTGALEWFIPTGFTGLIVTTDRPIVLGGVVYFRIPAGTEGVEAGLHALDLRGNGVK